MKDKAEKRFEKIYEEGNSLNSIGIFRIFKDTQTGIEYLFYRDGIASGLTPLLNKEGKVMIDLNNEI
jgi:hypothetical protein